MAFISTLLRDEPCGIIVKDTAFIDDNLLKDVLVACRRKPGGLSAASSRRKGGPGMQGGGEVQADGAGPAGRRHERVPLRRGRA